MENEEEQPQPAILCPKTVVDSARDKYPKKTDVNLLYGSSGFREQSSCLAHVAYRIGVLAVLKSKQEKGTLGVMITASHLPETINGFRLIGPGGEPMDSKWASFATQLVNSEDDKLLETLEAIVAGENISLDAPANIFIGFDSRPSSKLLCETLQDGVKIACGELKVFELVTTPELHYLVASFNSLGECKESTPEGYNGKLIKAFTRFHGEENAMDHLPGGTVLNPIIRNLINRKQRALKKWGKLKKLEDRTQLREIERQLKQEVKRERQRIGLSKGNCMPDLFMDCASGVGSVKMSILSPRLSKFFNLSISNTLKGDLNDKCGAYFVRTHKTFPKDMANKRKGERCLSIDGDADCLVYFYCTEEDGFVILDGNKIGALIASHIKKLVRGSNLELEIGFVQTKTANSSSTRYLKNELKIPVTFSTLGRPDLRLKAMEYDIGMYFEPNGHGSILFSKKATQAIRERVLENNSDAKLLESLMDLSNQVYGDAIANFLIVEGILLANGWSPKEWNGIYKDLPSCEACVKVCDKSIFEVSGDDKNFIKLESLQEGLDLISTKYRNGRCFVRLSVNRNEVKIYTEAETYHEANELSYAAYLKTSCIVGEIGDPTSTPNWDQPNSLRNLMDIQF